MYYVKSHTKLHYVYLEQFSPTFFTLRNPWNNFQYPKEPLPTKTFTRQKKTTTRSVVQLLLNSYQENLWRAALLAGTERVFVSPPAGGCPAMQTQCKEPRFLPAQSASLCRHRQAAVQQCRHNAKRQLVAHGDVYSTTNCRRQTLPRYFEGYLELFAVFQNFYLFIPRFYAEPMSIFCGALLHKHWSWA